MVSCCCPLTEWHSSVKLNSFQLKTVTCSSPVPVRRCVASSSSIFLHLSPRSHPSTPLRLLWAGDRRQTHSALMDKTLPPPTHPQLGSIVLTGEWTAQHEHPKALVWMRLNVSGVSELRRVIRWTSGPTGRCMFLQVWTVIEWLWKERCHFSWNHVYKNIYVLTPELVFGVFFLGGVEEVRLSRVEVSLWMLSSHSDHDHAPL